MSYDSPSLLYWHTTVVSDEQRVLDAIGRQLAEGAPTTEAGLAFVVKPALALGRMRKTLDALVAKGEVVRYACHPKRGSKAARPRYLYELRA